MPEPRPFRNQNFRSIFLSHEVEHAEQRIHQLNEFNQEARRTNASNLQTLAAPELNYTDFPSLYSGDLQVVNETIPVHHNPDDMGEDTKPPLVRVVDGHGCPYIISNTGSTIPQADLDRMENIQRGIDELKAAELRAQHFSEDDSSSESDLEDHNHIPKKSCPETRSLSQEITDTNSVTPLEKMSSVLLSSGRCFWGWIGWKDVAVFGLGILVGVGVTFVVGHFASAKGYGEPNFVNNITSSLAVDSVAIDNHTVPGKEVDDIKSLGEAIINFVFM